MPAPLDLARRSRAKLSYTTRNIRPEALAGLVDDRAPEAGDVVLARVTAIGQHKRIEGPDGRRGTLFEGDENHRHRGRDLGRRTRPARRRVGGGVRRRDHPPDRLPARAGVGGGSLCRVAPGRSGGGRLRLLRTDRLAVVAGAQAVQVGDPAAFAKAQEAWGRGLSAPWLPFSGATEAIIDQLPDLAMESGVNLAAMVLVGVALVVATRRLGDNPSVGALIGWAGWHGSRSCGRVAH